MRTRKQMLSACCVWAQQCYRIRLRGGVLLCLESNVARLKAASNPRAVVRSEREKTSQKISSANSRASRGGWRGYAAAVWLRSEDSCGKRPSRKLRDGATNTSASPPATSERLSHAAKEVGKYTPPAGWSIFRYGPTFSSGLHTQAQTKAAPTRLGRAGWVGKLWVGVCCCRRGRALLVCFSRRIGSDPDSLPSLISRNL